VETIFDNKNVNFLVGIVSTRRNDSFKEWLQVERFGAFLLSKIKSSNLSYLLSLKGSIGVPCEKIQSGVMGLSLPVVRLSPLPTVSLFSVQNS
jgi:hypothetical protein